MLQQVALLLKHIETELKILDLWSSQPPAATAFESSAPFCCDRMPLQQWLQFVFIPRMMALVEGELPLPSAIAVCPIAEEAFAPVSTEKLALINRIADLDKLLSGQRVQQSARD